MGAKSIDGQPQRIQGQTERQNKNKSGPSPEANFDETLKKKIELAGEPAKLPTESAPTRPYQRPSGEVIQGPWAPRNTPASPAPKPVGGWTRLPGSFLGQAAHRLQTQTPWEPPKLEFRVLPDNRTLEFRVEAPGKGWVSLDVRGTLDLKHGAALVDSEQLRRAITDVGAKPWPENVPLMSNRRGDFSYDNGWTDSARTAEGRLNANDPCKDWDGIVERPNATDGGDVEEVEELVEDVGRGQTHHVIPVNLIKNQDMFRKIDFPLDGPNNLFVLPTTVDQQHEMTLDPRCGPRTIHSGSHSEYDNAVRDHVEKLQEQFDNKSIDKTEMIEKLTKLQNEIKNALQRHDSIRDPGLIADIQVIRL